ncbi:MAG: hypothetical protein BWX70_02669 [Verrucomicrobia bacterium ADurb.Bin070]|nr:MAG: hypothetical protein BWX70_02669 [Verrucomicrobia bacterium ADurb.Bin070]
MGERRTGRLAVSDQPVRRRPRDGQCVRTRLCVLCQRCMRDHGFDQRPDDFGRVTVQLVVIGGRAGGQPVLHVRQVINAGITQFGGLAVGAGARLVRSAEAGGSVEGTRLFASESVARRVQRGDRQIHVTDRQGGPDVCQRAPRRVGREDRGGAAGTVPRGEAVGCGIVCGRERERRRVYEPPRVGVPERRAAGLAGPQGQKAQRRRSRVERLPVSGRCRAVIKGPILHQRARRDRHGRANRRKHDSESFIPFGGQCRSILHSCATYLTRAKPATPFNLTQRHEGHKGLFHDTQFLFVPFVPSCEKQLFFVVLIELQGTNAP